MGPRHPSCERKDSNNTDRHNSVVQSLARDRIGSWEAENDGDEADPTNGDQRYGAGEHAQVERPFSGVEFAEIDEADEDGDPVGDVEADCCDGCGGCEGD